MQLWAKWQLEYGDRGLSSNIVVPCYGSPGQRSELAPDGFGADGLFRVIVAEPADAQRIARSHVQKDGGQTPILFDGIISTTDNAHWRAQRKALSEVVDCVEMHFR